MKLNNHLLDTDDIMWEKKYPTFIINRCLSMFYDTIMHSNEMNGLHFLPKRMQFHYFINSIRKEKAIWWEMAITKESQRP